MILAGTVTHSKDIGRWPWRVGAQSQSVIGFRRVRRNLPRAHREFLPVSGLTSWTLSGGPSPWTEGFSFPWITFQRLHLPEAEYPVQFFRIQKVLEKITPYDIKVLRSDQVRDYLQRYPELIDLVPLVAHVVRSHLPNAQLTLTVYHDPEEEDEHLIIYARFAKYDDSALERIRHTRSIYRDMLTNCRGWIFLTTDFHSPESYAV